MARGTCCSSRPTRGRPRVIRDNIDAVGLPGGELVTDRVDRDQRPGRAPGAPGPGAGRGLNNSAEETPR